MSKRALKGTEQTSAGVEAARIQSRIGPRRNAFSPVHPAAGFRLLPRKNASQVLSSRPHAVNYG